MSEIDPTVTPEATAEPDDASIEAQAITDANGNKTVSLRALQEERALRQQLQARIKELEPVAARVNDLEPKLARVLPIAEAVERDPALRAQIQRLTRPSHEDTPQPQNDPDVVEFAEAMQMYTPEGNLDTARAVRAMKLQDARARRQSEAVVQPWASYTVGSRAQQHIQDMYNAVDERTGAPYATKESINEVLGKFGKDVNRLLADENVKDIVLDNAAGMDRRLNRTPKAQEEPLYMEAGAGRRSASSALSSEDREWCERNGVDPKRFQSMNVPTRGGRGIELGGKK